MLFRSRLLFSFLGNHLQVLILIRSPELPPWDSTMLVAHRAVVVYLSDPAGMLWRSVS
jgi:hypothetical protein